MVTDVRSENRPPLLVIAGPTASGKTTLAITLASRLNAELIGADSMQIYKHMNIGTDTPTEAELGSVKHHLVNCIEPDESYDAAKFMVDADAAVQEIAARKKRAVIVGGTGLYIRILLRGLQAGPPPNPQLREELSNKAAASGWPVLHRELEKLDPKSAQRLHPNDGVRIVRALEVVIQSGKPISQWQSEHAFSQSRYPSLFLLTDKPREELNRKINSRVDQMMKQGFLNEVEGLLKRGYSSTLKPMQALGYKHLCEHIKFDMPLHEAVEKTQIDTRRFAKRQRTWFKREKNVQKILPDLDDTYRLAADFFDKHEAQ